MFLTTILSCASKPKSEIILPPEPQREVLQQVENISDLADTINYYDTLVQLWEQWAIDVKNIIKVYNDSNIVKINKGGN